MSAQSSFVSGGLTYRVIKDADETTSVGLVSVTSSSTIRYEGDIVIPNAVEVKQGSYTERYKVIGVEDQAFIQCEDVTSVQFPASLEYIGARAFMGCSDLKEVSFPLGNLTKIGELAFAQTGLTSVKIPGSVSFLDGTFYQCKQLQSVVIMEGVTSMKFTFYQCDNLKDVSFPKSLNAIGDYSFCGCAFTSLKLPDSVVTLGTGVFSSNMNLRSVTIPNSLTTISEWAFGNCKALERVSLPKNLKRINKTAFSMCSALSSITIPASVKSIGERAFEKCSNLEEVIIENSATSISADAFNSCPKVKISTR